MVDGRYQHGASGLVVDLESVRGWRCTGRCEGKSLRLIPLACAGFIDAVAVDVQNGRIVGAHVDLTAVMSLDVRIHAIVVVVAAGGNAAPGLVGAKEIVRPDPVRRHGDARPHAPR